MDRRELLSRGGTCIGTATLTLLVGCTDRALQEAEREPAFVDGPVAEEEVDLPVDQKLGIAADGIRRAEDVEIGSVDALGAYLEGEGLAVESLEETTTEYDDEEVEPEVGVEEHEPVVALEYAVEASSDPGLAHHLGLVAGGYAVLIAAGHGSRKLDASVLEPGGALFGEYEVRTSWAEAYDAGERTPREYAVEVFETAEST